MAWTAGNIKVGEIAQLQIDSIDVGATAEPYSLSIEANKTDHRIEQSKYAVISTINERTATSEVTLAEVTLANMAIALGLPSGNIVTDALKIDSGERGNVEFVATTAAASAPGTGKHRVYTFPQSNGSGSQSINQSKEEMTVLSVTYNHLADSSGVVGEIADIAD